ncbi:MAG: hypothetical protein ACYDBV_15435 [Nitrospiria bacterium]
MNPDLLPPSEAIKENKFMAYVLLAWLIILLLASGYALACGEEPKPILIHVTEAI